jgi:N-acetylneuraminate synthase
LAPKIIAEIGINHNGQIELAKKMIAMAKYAGAAAVKFQVRDVDTVYAGQLDNPRNDGNPYGWKTVGEQKRGIELTLDQYKEINTFCEMIGIDWFASFWDMKSFYDHINLFDFKYHKIASAMLTNSELCEAVAAQGRLTFISTGGCDLDEIDDCIDNFMKLNQNICIMHCVSQYPCPDSALNLNMIHSLRARYPWARIGYSGHEVGLYPSVMALAMGVRWIERHITLDRSMYGSDQSASMEIHGLQQLCSVAKNAGAILGDGIKVITEKEKQCMQKLRYWR